MDAVELARAQFAITSIYHFFFVPLTMGLGLLVAVMQTQYVRTGDVLYKKMTKFWGKLFLINFAMGVVTGIVMEFQFGMNWSEYSRFVGDIFGAPLAVEALMAFFLESTFLGIWIFGWDRIPQKLHLASIWLAALGANLSAFWILVANSFMQRPVGFEIAESGRAEMVDFIALITNSNVLYQFPHVVLGALSTGAFFVVGISAFHLLRRMPHVNLELFRRSMPIGLWVGTVSVLLTMGVGHAQGQHMADTQPMKLAAAEGLWESADPASLSLFQIGPEFSSSTEAREALFEVGIPSLLSFLTYNTPQGEVQGINPLNEMYRERFADRYDAAYAERHGLDEISYIPPAIWLTYWSFRAMIGAGMAMFVLGALGLWFWRRGVLETRRLFLWLLFGGILLPYIAHTTGWLLTEFGRQPWIVYGEMRIEEAISPNVTVAMLWTSLIGFTAIYGLLMVADIYLLQKFARRGGSDEDLLPLPKGDEGGSSEARPATEGVY